MRRSILLLGLLVSSSTIAESLAPMRPLPAAANRAAATGRVYHVHPVSGDDTADGSKAKPWKTIASASAKLKAGDTLYLRGGVYYEAVTLSATGTAAAPITIRSAPGELAILDGGLREFAEGPKTAWEPVTGAAGEYRSTRNYPTLSRLAGQERGVWVTGNFADTMVPLHGYKFDADLRATNEYWNVEKDTPGSGVYVGPGVWFDWKTHRIHARLAHSSLKSQPKYAGPTDPRTLPLVVGIDRTPLRLDKAKHVRIWDVVVRGSAVRTVAIDSSEHVELDGVTIYGGSPALWVRSTNHFKLSRSNVRGMAAPWSSRASMKYRGASSYLVIAHGAQPQSHDWELAYNEFTDSHDGLVLDGVKTLRFHHNRVDNFNDDALYLTLVPRDSVPEDIHIYENIITRTYTAIAFGDAGATLPNPIGSGVYVFRNVFDLRTAPYVWPSKDAASDEMPVENPGRMCGDHGSPTWEPMFFYNNTVVTTGQAWRDYYGAALIIKSKTSKRRLFNNIFIRSDGDPGMYFGGMADGDLQVDANLMWGVTSGPQRRGDFFAKFRSSPTFEASKDSYAPGWGTHDLYADPQLAGLGRAIDAALGPKSPAIDAGIAIPSTWPDSLKRSDRGKPDIGALPAGTQMLRVGPASASAR